MKLENVVPVPVEEVERIHEEALLRGGAPGVLDRNLLISATYTPFSTFDGAPLYGSLGEMAATYAWSIARNHPFVDGNKRTALLTALTFLAMNGREITLGLDWVDRMVRVAADPEYTRSELVSAFRLAMGDDEPVV